MCPNRACGISNTKSKNLQKIGIFIKLKYDKKIVRVYFCKQIKSWFTEFFLQNWGFVFKIFLNNISHPFLCWPKIYVLCKLGRKKFSGFWFLTLLRTCRHILITAFRVQSRYLKMHTVVYFYRTRNLFFGKITTLSLYIVWVRRLNQMTV